MSDSHRYRAKMPGGQYRTAEVRRLAEAATNLSDKLLRLAKRAQELEVPGVVDRLNDMSWQCVRLATKINDHADKNRQPTGPKPR